MSERGAGGGGVRFIQGRIKNPSNTRKWETLGDGSSKKSGPIAEPGRTTLKWGKTKEIVKKAEIQKEENHTT